MKTPMTYRTVRLYRLVCLRTGQPYGHALPMSAAAKFCLEQRNRGFPTGIEVA